MRRMLCSVLPSVLSLALLISSAQAQVWDITIDPQSHNRCCTDFSSFVVVPVTAGTHTICLDQGPSPACPANGWGANVIIVPTGLGGTCSDYTWMALNGEGDCKTVDFAYDGNFKIGIDDGYVPDNLGTIVVSVDGTPYTIDPQVNYTVGPDNSAWVHHVVDDPGEYRLELISGPSPACPGNGWGACVLANIGGLGGTCSDYTWVALNGEGDSETFVIEIPFSTIHIGIEDGFTPDNQGQIALQLTWMGPIAIETTSWGKVKTLFR